MCFVIEYASQGSLMGKREESMLGKISNYKYAKSLRKWTMQILTSLHWLHQNKYIHGSLKGENIAIHASDNAVLIDFGRSKWNTDRDMIKIKKIESIELCQKNWKKWNRKVLVAVLMNWLVIQIEHVRMNMNFIIRLKRY
eukprot:GHVR01015822.1.p1 GENE.GHVR01015822.1~~GHVR01015822.1.p1  ORF type:complete len:140 (-),score=7.01 GHVR01015822.1:103-522(-)